MTAIRVPKFLTLRAEFGARLLDALDPDWAESIDLDKLDLGDCSACVLGQRFGAYGAGLEKVFAMNRNINQRDKAAEECGFVVNGNFGAKKSLYPSLTEAWVRQIAKRQKAAAARA